MLVRQILNSKHSNEVSTIKPEATVREAAELLSSKHIGAVIVSADGEVPVGVLSERDIVRELGKNGPGCMSNCVTDLMTADLIGCTLDQRSDQILVQMTEGRFRHMPVIENGKMVGLISIGDVVKARLSELHIEKTALEGIIMGH